MTNSLDCLVKSINVPYDQLSSVQKKDFLEEAYAMASFAQIANAVGTYTNRIKRDAVQLGIKSRSKTDAQKLSLSTGSSKHPTEGKHRSEEEKSKIGKKVSASYQELPDEEKERRIEVCRDNWNDRSEEDKEKFRKASIKAILATAKTGSKLEKFLMKKLISVGFQVDFHKERVIVNERMQLDMVIPSINTVIEVDGPSHTEAVWGDKALSRTQRSDQQKNSLLLGMGFVVIRVRQTQRISKVYMESVWTKLSTSLISIKEKFPERKNRYLEIQ